MEPTTKINKAIDLIARLTIDKTSQVLSKLIKSGSSIDMERAYIADITEATEKIHMSNDEVVGSYITLKGDAPFQFLFYVKIKDSLILTDLMLRREVGTAKEFDIYSSSTVLEIGNILASAISNVFAKIFQIGMTPTPPIAVCDYAGIVFEEYLMSIPSLKNEIMIIESKFNVIKNDIDCSMFLLPLGDSEKTLSYIANIM